MKQHPTMPDIWVTEDGRVFRELPPIKEGFGYHQINIGSLCTRRHVVVCETYHGPRPTGMHVRHLDGDPSNDHPSNLAWGTPSDNAMDSIRHGTDTRGSKNARAKINEADVKEIRARRAGGESGRSLAKEYGISEQAVCDIIKRRQWAHID